MRKLHMPRPIDHWEWDCLLLVGLVLFVRFPLKFFFGNPFLMDFNVYRISAELIASGQGNVLYDFAFSEGMYFKYAPIWAVLLSPLALISNHVGIALWSLLNVFWTVLAFALSGRILSRIQPNYSAWLCLAIALLFTRPLTSEFSNGQTDLWWGGLVVLFLYHELIGRRGAAALYLSLSLLLKLPSAIFLPYFLFTRRWDLAVRTLAWTLLLTFLGAYLVNPQEPMQPLSAWFNRLRIMAPDSAFMVGDQSLMALLGRLLTDDGYGLNFLNLPKKALALLSLVINGTLFGAIVLTARKHASDTFQLILDAPLLIILMIIASPSGWLASYTAILLSLFFALAWTLHFAREGKLHWPDWLLLAAAAVFNIFSHSKAWKGIGMTHWKSESYVFLIFMVVPLFVLMCYALLWRHRRRWLSELPDTSRS